MPRWEAVREAIEQFELSGADLSHIDKREGTDTQSCALPGGYTSVAAGALAQQPQEEPAPEDVDDEAVAEPGCHKTDMPMQEVVPLSPAQRIKADRSSRIEGPVSV